MKRTHDCDIDCFKHQDAMREVTDEHIVNAAMADILRGDFDSAAVHEVMVRRAGSMSDYDRIKDARDVAIRAVRHARAA